MELAMRPLLDSKVKVTEDAKLKRDQVGHASHGVPKALIHMQ